MKIICTPTFLVSTLLLLSCGTSEKRTKAQDDAINVDTIISKMNKGDDLANVLTSHLSNKVEFDSLLNKITCQEKVKVLDELSEVWDNDQKVFIYSDSNYTFKLKVLGDSPFPDPKDVNSILHDGKKQISFDDYKITCFKDLNFRCEDYGYNISNSLRDPKIIEVCGKRFLYSDVMFACNGMGCGCHLTMIYDLQEKKPTFIENFRIHFEGFFLSDFDNDNNPDLLVIGQSDAHMKGFDLDEFEINLVAYKYDRGTFKPYIDNQYARPYCYNLYGVGDSNLDYTSETYSITKDNWFRR